MVAPKLRFKRFTQQWNNDLLINLSQNGLSNGVFNDPANTGSGYKLINVVNMYKESSVCESDLTLIALDKKTFEKNKVHYSDIFFTRSSLVKEGIAWSNIYLGNSNDVTYDGHLIKLTPNIDKVYPIFLSYCLKTSAIRQQLIKKGKTATMTTIGQEDVASCVVSFPCIEEQTKIANFLSAVDERIQQVSQTHALLTQYKKGVMQKIFSQELRFKDENGEAFGEWEEKIIADLAEVNPKSNELPERFIYIDLESVQRGQLLKETSVLKVDAPSRAQRVLCKNDVLFQLVRPYQKNNFLFKRQGAYVASTGYAQLRAKESADFLYQLIHFDSFTTEVINRCTGTSYPAINSSYLATIEIRVPCLPEQTKIANFLSAIDDKINQAQSQLSALQDYKRGLLQQMFI